MVAKSIIGADKTFEIECGTHLVSDGEQIDLMSNNRHFDIYGTIYYRSPILKEDRDYERPFYWHYWAPSLLNETGKFTLGPDEFNRGT